MVISIHCPVIKISVEDYQKHTFVALVDFYRTQKVLIEGRYYYLSQFPFFILRMPYEFTKFFYVKKEMIPIKSTYIRKNVVMTHQKNFIYTFDAPQTIDGEELFHTQENGSTLHAIVDGMKSNTVTLKELDEIHSKEYFDNHSIFSYFEDIPFSLMDQIFTAHSDKLNQGWNFNRLDSMLSALVDTTKSNGIRKTIPGVTSSYTYFAEEGDMCSCHNEDLKLPSGNFLFMDSANKIWTGFFDPDLHKVNETLLDAQINDCNDPLIHKNVALPKEFYEHNNVQRVYGLQQPGDIVVTNGYHQVQNTGNSVAEAVNFYSHGTLAESSRYTLKCKHEDRHLSYSNNEWSPYMNLIYKREKEMKNGEELTNQTKISQEKQNEKKSTQIWKKELTNIDNSRSKCRRCVDNVSKDQIELQSNVYTNGPPVSSVMEALTEMINDTLEKSNAETAQQREQHILQNDTEHVVASSVKNNSQNLNGSVSSVTTDRLAAKTVESDDNETQESHDIFALNTHRDIQMSPKAPSHFDKTQIQSQSSLQKHNLKRKIAPGFTLSSASRSKQHKLDYTNKNHEELSSTEDIAIDNEENRMQTSPDKAKSVSPSQQVPQIINSIDTVLENSRILQNMKDLQSKREYYKQNKQSRQRASIKHELKRNHKEHTRSSMAAQFKSDNKIIQQRIKTAREYLNKHANYARQTSKLITTRIKMQADEDLSQKVKNLQELYFALCRYFGKENVHNRMIEGMNAYEIVRDFVNLDNPVKRAYFLGCMIAKKIQNTEFWTQVLTNKDLWIETFGIDTAFRIPCRDA